MKKLALSTALALALVPSAGIIFTATSAQAAVDQTQAEQLVRASLAQMGVTNPDAALVASMVAELLAQQDAGVIIDTSLLDPTPTPSPTDTTVPTVAPTESATPTPSSTPETRFGRHYREQSQLWQIASPLWNTAFDTIRTAYDDCVTAAVAGVDCAATLIPDLQVAHATALATAYDQIVADIAALPVDQQAAAQAALDLQKKNADDALTHVLLEYTPTNVTTGLVETTPAKLLELQAELQRKSETYRVTNPNPGNKYGNSLEHRQDAEHRNDNSLRTAAPTAAPQSSASASASSSKRSSDDFANRVRQSGRND